MDKIKKKLLEEAYDSLYNLKWRYSKISDEILEKAIDELEAEAKRNGYQFKVNQRSQRFKLYVLK